MDSNIEDFKNELKHLGYQSNDFTISGKDLTDWNADAIVPIIGTITVKRNSTNVERSYPSGHMSDWVVDCVDELKKGIFDK